MQEFYRLDFESYDDTANYDWQGIRDLLSVDKDTDLEELYYTKEKAEEIKEKLDNSNYTGYPVKLYEVGVNEFINQFVEGIEYDWDFRAAEGKEEMFSKIEPEIYDACGELADDTIEKIKQEIITKLEKKGFEVEQGYFGITTSRELNRGDQVRVVNIEDGKDEAVLWEEEIGEISNVEDKDYIVYFDNEDISLRFKRDELEKVE